MAQHTLEKRVAVLERQVAELLANGQDRLPVKDWRNALGVFSPETAEFMKQVDAAGRAIREKERREARRRGAKSRAAKR